MKIFLDMDDVVADWRAAVEGYLGWQFPDGDAWAPMPAELRDRLPSYQHMYRDLRLLSGAQQLVQLCRRAVYTGSAESVQFLTAIPRELHLWPHSLQDKVEWVQHYFVDIPVLFSQGGDNKFLYAEPGDVLIDDRAQNCQLWRAVGGIAVQYQGWDASRAALESALGL